MVLFVIGFLLYSLVLVVEQALARLSTHDLEVLREGEDQASLRAVTVAEKLRSSMAALLLARVLLLLSMGTGIVDWLLRSRFMKNMLYEFSLSSGMPGWLIWSVTVLTLTSIMAFLLWTLQRINLVRNRNQETVHLLQRLGWYVLFWKKLFKPFLKTEPGPSSPATDATPTATPETTQSANSEKRELELLKSIVQFGDVTVKQVMQPRSKVVAVDFRTSYHQLLNTVCETEFSRMPVIDEDLDNVTGILYVKDLVPYLDKPDDFEWQTLIRTNLMLVPESKRGSELLEEFKKEKMHMAVVVDEYGGSSGIVTLEDILEEVIGDIHDEFDKESDIRYRKLDEYNYLFEGQALLNDVCRITGIPGNAFDAIRGNSDTLAGLALELRGDIPPAGEEIVWGQFMLTVMAADNRKIDQLKLSLPKG